MKARGWLTFSVQLLINLLTLIDLGGEGFELLSGPSPLLAMDWQEIPVSRVASTASVESKTPFTSLLLERAGVSGNAQPFAIRIDPGVGESPVMIEGLMFV